MEGKREAEEHAAKRSASPPERLIAVNMAERALERTGDHLWRVFRRRPYVGAVLAGAAGLGLASALGVAELAVAVGAGYAAYQVLKYRMSPTQAVRKAFELEEPIQKGS